MKEKYEYCFVIFSDFQWYENNGSHALDSLNVMGNVGWEVINISADTGNGVRYLMKRIKE